MPVANVGDVERWLQDHDSDEVLETPPIQNTWYEVFHAEDVRLLWCFVVQSNTDLAAKDVELRWTIDGNVYFVSASLDNNTWYFAYRDWYPSAGGTAGLIISTTRLNAGNYADKRGLDFKVEIRMTSVPGANQSLRCDCVRETKEIT